MRLSNNNVSTINLVFFSFVIFRHLCFQLSDLFVKLFKLRWASISKFNRGLSALINGSHLIRYTRMSRIVASNKFIHRMSFNVIKTRLISNWYIWMQGEHFYEMIWSIVMMGNHWEIRWPDAIFVIHYNSVFIRNRIRCYSPCGHYLFILHFNADKPLSIRTNNFHGDLVFWALSHVRRFHEPENIIYNCITRAYN